MNSKRYCLSLIKGQIQNTDFTKSVIQLFNLQSNHLAVYEHQKGVPSLWSVRLIGFFNAIIAEKMTFLSKTSLRYLSFLLTFIFAVTILKIYILNLRFAL